MTLSLHTINELINAALCLWAAHVLSSAYDRTQGSLAHWAGFGASWGAVTLFVHSIASWLNPELVAFWVPVSWAMAAAGMYGFAIVGLSRLGKRTAARWSLVGVALALASVGASFAIQRFDLSWVYGQRWIVYRPLDAALMLVALAATVMAWRGSYRKLAGSFAAGAACHFIMAFFSSASLDTAFSLAHWTKTVSIALLVYSGREIE